MALCPVETGGGGRAASLCTGGPRPTESNPALFTSSTHHRTARQSTAGGSTASPSLCPATRQWWWSTATTTTLTCFRKNRKRIATEHPGVATTFSLFGRFCCIGRSTECPIDFVVTDTSGEGKECEDPSVAPSTISRFACRVVCERNPPYTARIYAAGFDSSKNIFLGEKATKWKNPDGHMDGLTTNGVLVMHPEGFPEDNRQGLWREISVCGDVYALRETRSGPSRGKLAEGESSALRDGSLVDLCGATLLWRTGEGLLHAPTLRHLEALRQELNAARPQCPVGLSTLAFPSLPRSHSFPFLPSLEERQPWVYLTCGHVHGRHDWGQRPERREARGGEGEGGISTVRRECPLCRSVGPYVPLWLGCEPAVYVDAGAPTYAFVPCGHVCSERTAKYWADTPLPHGTHAFRPTCPFCSAPLSSTPQGWTRLIFQGPID
ncbi:E3 ubiquitin-protein ligase pellino homolog 2-like isoform X2 [Oncorhynchus nerka]|uniref:E3 ubiquitin-protein ligase pellino homolog 2-like isoform X2 n=1 Tax=Oncorhynchus nerka TaxID=8023 RepID=UPI0031B7F724